MLKRMVSDQGCPGSSSAAAAGGGGDRPRVGAGAGGALFAVPRLLVGLAAKQRAADGGGESERSPTSPLDPKALLLRSPRSPRAWDSEPVGLGLVVDANASSGPNPLLSPRLRLKSHCSSSSAPKGCGGGGHSQPELGKTTTISCPAGMSVPCSRFFRGDLKSGPETAAAGAHSSNGKRHSFDLGKLPGPGPLSLPAPTIAGGGPRRFVASVSASEVEQSEDYTCIIARGPNPKTTHIFGDCILEPQAVAKSGVAMEVEQGAAKYSSYLVVKCAAAEDGAPAAAEDFLSSCFACRKKLEGNDIYIYRIGMFSEEPALDLKEQST
ncbi:hypothetical protein BRADI_2g05140v3 [Brachypodium distachyon]|uniref:FLZ-type domain-containing protein n=1 Tax=Brachypodium distachyon TaxID=15368 RepID=A0A2K2D725_BRADI|nr:hypothetical protein BRADI_2g05140v3 [Brachypodium distachyon]